MIAETIEILGRDGLAGRSLVEAVVDATGAQRRRVYRLVTGSAADQADDS
jgi:hypothetical protein